jgi:hypothetical protein
MGYLLTPNIFYAEKRIEVTELNALASTQPTIVEAATDTVYQIIAGSLTFYDVTAAYGYTGSQYAFVCNQNYLIKDQVELDGTGNFQYPFKQVDTANNLVGDFGIQLINTQDSASIGDGYAIARVWYFPMPRT